MEREREIRKLMNVLERTARMARQAELTGANGDAGAYCARQYNQVLARLVELDPEVGRIFQPLDEGASLTVVAIACRQVTAYFEDEASRGGAWGKVFGIGIDADACEQVWGESVREVEDLGQFIRESIDAWARGHRGRRHRRGRTEEHEHEHAAHDPSSGSKPAPEQEQSNPGSTE